MKFLSYYTPVNWPYYGKFRDTEITRETKGNVFEHDFVIRLFEPHEYELLLKIFGVEKVLRVVKLRIVVSEEKECDCLRENINKHFERWKHSSLTHSERAEASIIYAINKELEKLKY